MRVRGVRRQRAFDRGFVLSDHADWPALLATIAETGAAASSPRTVTPSRSRGICRNRASTTGVIRTAWEGEMRRAMNRDATVRRLFDAIDRTTSTNAKVAAMRAYFGSAPPADAAWAVFFLTGRRLKRLVPSAAIRDWTLAATGLADWMLGECYRSSATAPRRRRSSSISCPSDACGRPVTEPVARRAHPASSSSRSGSAAGACDDLVAGAGSAAALHPAQAADRRAARRRLADAGRARACRSRGARDDGHRRAADGRVDADRRVVRIRPVAGADGRRPVAPVSVLPRRAARRRTRAARRPRRLAGRVEVGRHPRAAGPARPARSTSGRAARS